MNRSAHFFRLLGVTPGADEATVKSAYHRLAKRNHPDLFPDDHRRVQQLKMMRINEAYMGVMSELLGEGEAAGRAGPAAQHAARGPESPASSGARGAFDGRTWTMGGFAHAAESHPNAPDACRTAPDPQCARSTDVGQLKDPAYAYYKAGFRWWQAGLSVLSQKDPKVLRRHYLAKDKKSDGYILRLAMRALHHFERAYTYFLVVVEQYPQSIWRRDAQWRLTRLENYSVLYQRICDNLSRNLSTVEQPFNGAVARE
jgi:hypothetical protein